MNTVTAPPLVAGEVIGAGYSVVEHVRRGRDLDTYDVWSEARQCLCIAKALRPDRTKNHKTRRRLIAEGNLLQRLTHPHLVRAYELIREPSLVLILETLSGATLEYLLVTQHRRMPLAEVAFLGMHLCSAMYYLHGNGYLHLDLKPSNLICENGLTKVIDLSIARHPGPSRAGIGTRQFMAPEQARGGVVTPAADVWGIGVVLFGAATGRPPFQANDGTRYDQLERRADPVRRYRRVPRYFGEIVDACLEITPAQRPTISEVSAHLERLAAGPAPVADAAGERPQSGIARPEGADVPQQRPISDDE